MTPVEYSLVVYLEILGLFPEEANDRGYTAEAYSNVKLARAELYAERAAEYEQTMRHVRQTAGYQKYGAYGVYGGSK